MSAEKHFTYEAKSGKKYKINPSHFLGNSGDAYAYMFTIDGGSGEFNLIFRLPRAIALKKWKLANRTEEEKALVQLGSLMVKKELDHGNEQEAFRINFSESLAKDTLAKTLQALEK
ncbi:MAG: hypothetical protein HZC17_08930 [Candidatus Omnitrophica bacterium]|nr:hypothetical protein [Candidatus Omnitrophota bacterium]